MTIDLDLAGKSIVHRLGGHWSNGRGMCRCPAHPDKTPSLSVRTGTSTLLFKCFAGCTITEILQGLRRERLNTPFGASGAAETLRQPQPGIRAAARLWKEARPLTSTPARRYLEGRAIMIGSPALRYHSATPLGAGRAVRFLPALIASVTHDGALCGIQRSFLQLNGRPALFKKHKRSLGPLGQGAVKLAAATHILGLAEGIENALSASILLGIPVWASLGAERFDKVAIPPQVTCLVLLADNDAAGRRAVGRARSKFAIPGREIVTSWPPDAVGDWNDMLRAGGKVEVEGRGWRPDSQEAPRVGEHS
ncbi:DUF7146 domain-containing protein [Sphingobium sp.]|uniref:DUF7146 domain-containing protein n=1 Tax=Sphingobium sp. TaxID=1912891 RepID=UPI002CA5FA76|nr:toprim domain-containing protein [Sphingobium sp.]HUD93604.1 toprim domain-containing protein [Sphingobium sp.]